MNGFEKRGKYWSKRYKVFDTITGKEIRKRFNVDENGNKFLTRKDCEEAFIRFKSLQKGGKSSQYQTKVVLFSDLLDKFLNYQKTQIRPTSCISYDYIIKSHILPTFENMKLESITPLVLHEWLLSKEHYSYTYKSKIRNCLSQILSYGAKYFNTPNNLTLVENYSKSKAIKKEMSIWTPQDFKCFIEKVDNFKDMVMFSFLYMMGTRKGEMGALQWQDLNLTKKTCTIKKTLTRTENGLNVGTSTKNSKHRVLAIPTALNEQLKELYVKERKRAGFNQSWFVFAGEKHLHFSPLDRKFQMYFEKTQGLKKIRIHDFRHSHTSLLINKASSTMSLPAMLYSIAERLGDSVEQVLRTYGHLFPNTQKDLVATLDDI